MHELRNKRFGLSDTVFAQIKRYSEASRRKQRTDHGEAAGIARLIGRRPDAEAVFREAGRQFARQVYRTISPLTRRMMRSLPALLTRPLALRQVRRVAKRHLQGTARRTGGSIILDVSQSVTQDAAPKLGGCAFYESALREFIQLLEQRGELVRIRAEVDPDLEITEITDRVSKSAQGGPALLFESVKGHPGAQLLINQFGSARRMCQA